jgi:hypothetical protein
MLHLLRRGAQRHGAPRAPRLPGASPRGRSASRHTRAVASCPVPRGQAAADPEGEDVFKHEFKCRVQADHGSFRSGASVEAGGAHGAGLFENHVKSSSMALSRCVWEHAVAMYSIPTLPRRTERRTRLTLFRAGSMDYHEALPRPPYCRLTSPVGASTPGRGGKSPSTPRVRGCTAS